MATVTSYNRFGYSTTVEFPTDSAADIVATLPMDQVIVRLVITYTDGTTREVRPAWPTR